MIDDEPGLVTRRGVLCGGLGATMLAACALPGAPTDEEEVQRSSSPRGTCASATTSETTHEAILLA